MAAVFISYRRDDLGCAIQLQGALDNHFDVFFDKLVESIPLGDEFAERLEGGLEECRVFLVLIGPGWLSERNLKRLEDPNDWVRREVTTALDRRPGVRVVPVLMGGADIPAEERVPPDVRPLLGLQGCRLRDDGWQADTSLLIGQMRKWAGTSAADTSARVAVADQVLPLCQLCDRTSQQTGLARALAPAATDRNHPALILYGHKEEAHCGFVESLEYRKALHGLLGIRDAHLGVELHPLQWDKRAVAGGRYRETLVGAIAANALSDASATEAQVRAFLREPRQPVVLFLYATHDDLKAVGSGVLAGFVEAWRSLFEPAPGEAPFAPPFPVMLWLLVTWDNDQQARRIRAAVASLGAALPELEALVAADVQTWIQLPDVKSVVRDRSARIEALPEDERFALARHRLRMAKFVEGVRQIFA